MTARIREIAKSVKDLRYRLDMTQAELAATTRLALRTISVYETGDTPGSPLGLLRFARVAMEHRYMDLVRIFLKDEPDTWAIYETLDNAWNHSERALQFLDQAMQLAPPSAVHITEVGSGKSFTGIPVLSHLLQQARAEINAFL